MNRPSDRRGGSKQGSGAAGRRTTGRDNSSSKPSYGRGRDDIQGSSRDPDQRSDNRGGSRFGGGSGGDNRPRGGFNKDRFVNRDGDQRRDDRGADRSNDRGGYDQRGPGQGGEGPRGNRNQKASERYPDKNRNRFSTREGSSFRPDDRGDRGPRRDDGGNGGPRGGFRNDRGDDRPRAYGDRDNRGQGNGLDRGGFRGNDRNQEDRRAYGDRDNRGNDHSAGRGPRNFDRDRNDRGRPSYGDRDNRGQGSSYNQRPERNDRGAERVPRDFNRDDQHPQRGYGDRGQNRAFSRDERPNRGPSGEGQDRRFESRPYERRDDRKDRGAKPPRAYKPSTDENSGLSPNRETLTGGSANSFAENATKRTYSKMRQNEDRMKRNGQELPKEGDLPETLEEQEMRLNRYIAASGLCSRREADNLIAQGSISVNGKIITEMGHRVEPGDKVEYGGKLLRPEKFVYVLMNKPKDFITTKEDEEGRRTVMDLLEGKVRERIYPVGRLDRNTTGLLLLTNDGDMAERLMHPSFEIKKIYQADLDRPLSEADFAEIKKGVTLEDGPAKVDDLAVLSPNRMSIGLEIHIGRNRIVRRIFESLGYNVVRLDRVMYGGLTKKDLPRGRWRFLSPQEIMNLKYYA